MLEAVLKNGWLADVDAVLTGYVPTVGHAEFCRSSIAQDQDFQSECNHPFAIRSLATNRAGFTSTRRPRTRFVINSSRSPIS